MKAGYLVALLAAGGALVGVGAYLARASASSPAVTVTTPPPVMARHATTPAPSPRRAAPAPVLASELHDADPRVRRVATAELAHDPAADPQALLAASRDPDLEVSAVATLGLARLYAAGELPASELVARVRDHGLPEKVRASALNGLGSVPTAETAALFADLVAHGDILDRRSAAALLAQQDPAVAVPALIGALGDADEYVRGNAVEALRRFGRGRDYGTDANAWRSWWQTRGS